MVLVVPATRAVVEAVAGRRTPFTRTPKDGRDPAESARVEVVLAVYSTLGMGVLVGLGAWAPASFQALLALATAGGAWAARRPPPSEARSAPSVSAPRAAA